MEGWEREGREKGGRREGEGREKGWRGEGEGRERGGRGKGEESHLNRNNEMQGNYFVGPNILSKMVQKSSLKLQHSASSNSRWN